MLVSQLMYFPYSYKNDLFSVYSDVNQLTNAKINTFSLVHIIEILPELRFKYMGSYLLIKFVN